MSHQRFIVEFLRDVVRPIGRRKQIAVTRPTCTADRQHR